MYCAAEGESLLPQPPAGHIWVDALSGWVPFGRHVVTEGRRCLVTPSAEPRVLRLLPFQNASFLQHEILEEERAATRARMAAWGIETDDHSTSGGFGLG